MFGVSAERKTRLVHGWGGRFTALLVDGSQLDKHNIMEGQQLRLEEKDGSGEWQMELAQTHMVPCGGYSMDYGVC